MQDVDECHACHDQIRKDLQAADDQWWALEAHLEKAEEEVLETHAEALKGWFGLQASVLSDWSEGGLRSKVRGRVHKLLLAPLAERMRRQVDFPGAQPAADDKEGGQSLGHILDELLDRWETEVDTLVCEAGAADDRLARRARRRAKFGAGAAEGISQADARQRLAAWAPARGALEAFKDPAQRLVDFAKAEISEEAIARLAAIVPAVVARAVCDFHFQGYASEFEQLEAWWDGAKAALQRREGLWQRLLQEEGLFVRRVERGIEALRAAGHRYQAFADFGAGQAVAAAAVGAAGAPVGGWPGEAVSLLASAISDFRKRLRPIRDCAAWRVVEAAKSIHRRLRADSPAEERPQWELAKREEGVAAMCKALDAAVQQSGDQPAAAGTDPADVALVLMRRVDGLVALLGELRDAFHAEVAPGAGGVGDVLAEVMRAAASMSEELLALLDEPSQEGLDAWSRRWEEFGEGVGGQRLEAAMAVMPALTDSSLPPERRRARRRRLLLLRGAQALLEDASLRRRLAAAAPAAALAAPAAEAAAPPAAENAAGGLALAMPREEAAPPAVDSPRGSCLPRRPRRETEGSSGAPSPRAALAGHMPAPTAAPAAAAASAPVAEEVAVPAASASMPAVPAAAPTVAHAGLPSSASAPAAAPMQPEPAPVFPAADARATAAEAAAEAVLRSGMATASSSRPETASTRPGTPSWLQPPWPRPNTPSAFSWTRPDTPSTACDDAEVTPVPRWKFVNGEYVQLRPTSSASRLPPLMPSQQPAAAKPRQVPATVW